MLASGERPVEENPPLNRDTHAPSSSPAAFGRFRVVHQVGAGVLGPVFRAFDPDTDRTVALKSFPLDLTPEQAARLGESLARLATLDLGHPALIVPIAAGAEGSTAYLVEEYFVADSVDIAIRQYGPAPVPDGVRLVGQLAGALDFAAAAGIHHGALHPRDVLVAPREVRLTGIGVAQALEEVGYRIQPRRPYSAPERGVRGEWGMAADVYSLAAIAYELLTGRRPTASGDTVTIEPQAVPSPDAAALGEVFARAFSAAPGDRFSSALAFATALKHALTGQPIESPADAERPKSRRGRPGARRAGMLPLDEVEEGHAPAPPQSEVPSPAAGEPLPPSPTEGSVRLQPDVLPMRQESDSTPAAASEPPVAAAPEPFAAPVPPLPPPVEQPLAEAESSTPLPAESSEVREALLAAEPELPAPPPAVDDLDLRVHGPEPSVPPVDEPYELHVTPAPAVDGPRFTDVSPESEAVPERRLETPAPPAATPAVETGRPRASDESTPPPPRLTPGYRPPTPPRRSSSAATMLIVVLMAVALAIAGGYYATSRYLGRGTPTPASTTPAAPASGAGSGGAAAPQGQVPTPSLESVPPEPSLPAAEPPAPGNAGGAPATAAGTPGKQDGAPPARKTGAGAAETRVGAAAAKTESSGSSSRAARSKRTPAPAPRAAAASSSRRSSSAVFEGALSIASRPSGARVFLDGHPVGTTPMTLSKVSAGSHVVRLQSDGYATWSGAIQVTAGQPNRVTASLDRVQR